MKRVVVFICLLAIFLVLPLVSAGFFDFWKKPTGNGIQYSPGDLGKLEAKGVELESAVKIRSNQTQNETHKICSGTSCITIQGAGTNECNYDYQCGSNQTQNETHKICSGTSCITIQGAGTNECNYDYQCGSNFQCGDANADDTTNIFDITYLIAWFYLGGPAPDSLWASNVNGDEFVNIFDITYLISYLYKGGPDLECAVVNPGNQSQQQDMTMGWSYDKTVKYLSDSQGDYEDEVMPGFFQRVEAFFRNIF
ncbi:MAG: dockerin type I repeat-containing protein [Nanoarchaeota archaeon]|nr:dockerin type I repeat-containing protein [Nanoarchaeota archaeon]MBU1027963.1 dockerin type I repeat-containing protein [Nanoarchaeota archaeon]